MQRNASTPLAPLVTFVCTANVCRSPWAELFARSLTRKLRFSSAGVLAVDGNPMDPVMAETLPAGARRVHLSQLLDTQLVDCSTLILTMEARHKNVILDDWPYAEHKLFSIKQFVDAVEGLPRYASLPDALHFVYARRRPSRATGDVADPFQRGVEAAQVCARELTDLVTRSIRALEPVAGRACVEV